MELVSLHLGFAAAPGFAHNWVTRLQQGRCGALLVLLPYLASKIAHRRSQGRVWFSLQNKLTPPPKGGGAGHRLSFTTGAHWPNRADLGALVVLLPYSAPKTAHRATQGRVWFWLAGWRF